MNAMHSSSKREERYGNEIMNSTKKDEQKNKSGARSVPHPLIVVAFGIFGYLLWLRYHLFVQSHNRDFIGNSYMDDAPVTRAKSGESFRLKKLAKNLMASFSAQDGIASADREGFEISFPTKGNSSCYCDIVSADCLDTISCLKSLQNPQMSNALAWMGIEIRNAMKANSDFMPIAGNRFKATPLGKSLQYWAMRSWTAWRTRNAITVYDTRGKNRFIDPSRYPQCHSLDNGKLHPVTRYDGFSCFYNSPRAPEDSAGTLIEDEAVSWYNSKIKDGKSTQRHIRHLLDEFMRKHQPLEKDGGTGKFDIEGLAMATYNTDFSPLGNLILFAQMTRLQFNRRPFLNDFYKKQLTSVVVPNAENPDGSGSNQNYSHNEDPFIVALHMRRGDSCGLAKYETSASPLFSKPQMGGDRKCYQTDVYLQAVTRIRKLVPKKRPIHVYLATDDVGNVIDEILHSNYKIDTKEKNNGSTGNVTGSALGVDKWYFLNIPRDMFDGKSDSIEAVENEENHPVLGEAAVTDLWLLSHGHAFVGHLGSRFGKVAWLLAMARRNNFIPFFSVDGHSFCCEIDEGCGKMKPYITINNCLSFGHEFNSYKLDDYWNEGSTARKERFENDKERRTSKIEEIRMSKMKEKSSGEKKEEADENRPKDTTNRQKEKGQPGK